MPHDFNGPVRMTGTVATASLKQKIVTRRAANQDQPISAQATRGVVDLAQTLNARRTLSEKQFLRQREKFRFVVLEQVLKECIGVDVEVLWPQDYFKKRARKRLVDYIDVVRDGLLPQMIRVNEMLHPVRSIELRDKAQEAPCLKLVSLLGEHPLTEHVDLEDIAQPIKVKGFAEPSALVGANAALVVTMADGQETLLNECDGVDGRNVYEEGLGAQDFEADDLWLEDQNASMADIQFWWVDGDEADLIALGRGVGEVIFVGQARVSTAAFLAID